MKNCHQSKIFNKITELGLALSLIMALFFSILSPNLSSAEETLETPENIISEPEPTKIVTGDALSAVSQESEINTNTIKNTTSQNETENIASTTSDPNIQENNPVLDSDNTTSSPFIFIDTQNQSISTNTASTTASTGGNTTNSENFITETGDAVAYVDLTNVVNTNIVNSTGLIDFIHNVLGYENFDMRDTFSDIFNTTNTALSTPACDEDICNPNAVFVDMVNQANINNDVTVVADTGNNSSDGLGLITTGNAYANTNIVNLANTNIVDSNYLLLVFNNFSDMAGSLVLPNSDFFQSYFKQTTNQSNGSETTNSANINNDINIYSNTGNNTISGTGVNTITTGDSFSASYLHNSINQNYFNTNSFSMLIRVQGNWTGNIFGLPEGMRWENTRDGIRLFYVGENGDHKNSETVTNITNDANINNNVQIYALTGNNQINGDGVINTGNTYADSTIFNIANNNIIGSNWTNLIFNIYGNWNGDIAFGQPDLWLALSVKNTTRKIMRSGEDIAYTYTVFNHGDVTAKNVTLESEFPLSALDFKQGPIDKDNIDGKTTWLIGDIKAGETKEFTVSAKILESFAQDKQLPLPLNAKVYSNQPDSNPNDNYDTLMLYVHSPSGDSNYIPKKSFPAKLTIEKTADKDFAQAGDTVNYSIKIINHGGPVYNALLVDALRDEKGNTLNEQTWPLDTIKNGETINITYSINLPSNITNGIYTNSAQLVGLQSNKSLKYGKPYESATAKHQLSIGLAPAGQMLSFTENIPTCSPYLNAYLRQGYDNNADEVRKLQTFLKEHVSTDIVVSGIFDDTTRIAVENFQQQYKEDILTPWNVTESSGYVYYTTKKKINEIMCDNQTKFPLTEEQEAEIEHFKLHKDNSNEDLLFSAVSKPNPDQIVLKSTINEDVSLELDNNYQIPLPKSLHESDFSYVRLNNWIYLFQKPETAYLYP